LTGLCDELLGAVIITGSKRPRKGEFEGVFEDVLEGLSGGVFGDVFEG
jgi:hypothetical protein